MKKSFLILSAVAIIGLNANGIIVTKQQAEGQGKSMASAINMNVNASYQDKISSCEKIATEAGMLTADNRAEVLPYLISSCKQEIKK